jgi:glutaredoxin
VVKLELYGTARCPYTQELREWLEWNRKEFTEYDVERDAEARQRFQQIAKPPFAVPVLVENGKIIEVGYRGRTCPLDA